MYQRKYCGGGMCVSGERMIRSYENGSVIDDNERAGKISGSRRHHSGRQASSPTTQS